MFDVAAYLLGKGLRGRPASGGRELVYPCFFDCQESPDSRKRKLYVNAEEATFQCKICNSSGGSYLLQKHFGDNPRTDSSNEPFVRRQILDWAADLGAEMLANREDVLLYLLEERGLGPETIVERKLGFVGDNWSLTGSLPADFTREQLATTGLVHRDGPRAGRDFFTSQILIPIMHRGHALSIRGRAWGQARGGKYMSGPGEVVRAYNLDSLDGAEEVILTEGEFDCMRLAEVLASSGEDRAKRIAVVGLPGTNSIPDDLDSYLADVKRIFIGFDADEPGKLGAEKLRDRYGIRARVLELPDKDGKAADWTDYLLPAKDDTAWRFAHPFAGHGASDVLQLMSAASGKRIFSMAESGASFRSTRQVTGGLKTGYRQLDAVIEPGLLPGQVVFILAKTGVGKGSPHSTLVPTPGGFRKWGDLVVGDEVFGSDGRPTTVTGIYDRGSLPTYEVRFSDGASLRVDGDHLWSVSQRAGHRREWRSSVLSTAELMAQGLRKGPEFRWVIPMAQPVQYPEADLPVEPYTLGALLANGYLGGTSAYLTTPDDGVIERIRRHYEVNQHARYGCPRYAVQGLIGALRQLGVCQLSPDKFIPDQYLRASVPQRIALLQGLMDGDGSSRAKQRRRSVLYFTSSRRLASDMCELVNSLGGTATEQWTVRGDRRPEGKVNIMLPKGISAFSTPRKDLLVEATYSREPRRAIVAIEPVGDEEIRCISVAASDQLYLAGREYIVTHNTLVLCNLAYNMRGKRILFVSLEMTREEVYHRLERIYYFHNPLATVAELEYALSTIWICDENRLGEKDIQALVSEYEIENGVRPDVVMIDYLGYYARGFKGNSPYEKTTSAAMQQKADAKAGRLVIISPAQVNRGGQDGKPLDLDDARDSGAIEETGDFVLSVYRPENALSPGQTAENVRPSGTLRMSVLKSRHGGVGRTFSLAMDLITLAIVDAESPKAKIVEDHNYKHWRALTWDELRAQQTAPRQLAMGGDH